MKQLLLTLALCCGISSAVMSGTAYSTNDMKQVQPAPCPEWYGDNEFNITGWGTYLFTNTDYNRNLWLVDVTQSTVEGNPVLGSYDRYIGGDHAWGGGGDIKYFFHRYFGVGVEGFVVDANKGGFDIFETPGVVFSRVRTNHDRAVESVLGTFTLRYPIPCTRFAPYAWAGIGAILGGGERDQLFATSLSVPPDAFNANAVTVHHGEETKLLGQFGFGLEIRILRNLGWTNDISWGVIDGPRNNFGMVRSGLNFAF